MAEGQADNSYHCATPDCIGWCMYEDDVNSFYCETCGHWNCITCRAIHENVDCITFQRQLKATLGKDFAAKLAESSLEVIALR